MLLFCLQCRKNKESKNPQEASRLLSSLGVFNKLIQDIKEMN